MEIGLTREVDPAALVAALDSALPDGIDVLDAAVAEGEALADRIDGSHWRLELPGVDPSALRAALTALLAETSAVVERVTPSGRREIDVRAALVHAEVLDPELDTAGEPAPGAAAPSGASPPMPGAGTSTCAIMTAVVRQTTPAVRPDDVLGALDVVAGLRLPAPAKATRTAQGLLDHRGDLADPLGSGRVTTRS